MRFLKFNSMVGHDTWLFRKFQRRLNDITIPVLSAHPLLDTVHCNDIVTQIRRCMMGLPAYKSPPTASQIDCGRDSNNTVTILSGQTLHARTTLKISVTNHNPKNVTISQQTCVILTSNTETLMICKV